MFLSYSFSHFHVVIIIIFFKNPLSFLNRLQMVCVFIMNRMNAQSSGFTQRRRMALGIVILLLVDVIWVASSELTSVCSACPGMMLHYNNNIPLHLSCL